MSIAEARVAGGADRSELSRQVTGRLGLRFGEQARTLVCTETRQDTA